MSFVSDEVIQNLGAMDRSRVDDQPFGIVKLADDGTVELYNRWESKMAGVDPMAAEGKNFFTKVAPCTNNRLVYGKFKDGVSSGELDTEFDYTFTYRMKPTMVKIRMMRDDAGANWFFVAKR